MLELTRLPISRKCAKLRGMNVMTPRAANAGAVSQRGANTMTDPIVLPNPETDNLKRCTKCGEWKPATLEYFPPQKKTACGLGSWCRICFAAHAKRYRESLPRDPQKKRRKRHAVINGMKKCTKCGEEKPATLDHFPEYKAAGGGLRSWCRECVRKNTRRYSRENPDKVRGMIRKWISANPDKVRVSASVRRARKANADGTFTAADIRTQYESQRGKCWYCGKKVGDKYEVDHRIPLSRGGSNAPENLVIACRHCNRSKHDKMPWEFDGRLL